MVAVVTKTAAEGREGARGSRRCWPRLRLFKGRTWLITVLLKTLIFISNPDGIASLAYLLAGLAVFCFLFFFGWTCYLTVIYSAQGFRAVLWGKRVMVIIYQSTQFIECLLLFQESAREAPPGSSWRPRAGLASSPVPHPLPRPRRLRRRRGRGAYLFSSASPVAPSSSPRPRAAWRAEMPDGCQAMGGWGAGERDTAPAAAPPHRPCVITAPQREKPARLPAHTLLRTTCCP